MKGDKVGRSLAETWTPHTRLVHTTAGSTPAVVLYLVPVPHCT